ncbi:MAG: flagellin [Oscillospiraceae bacterium]|nr:flagellin [Oscillospiraceae bacterium]
MVVRTNTMSTNAYRQLSTNNTQLSKSLEKLSSGYRINRAGDDASGLAISEKMKAQIKGLEQASANSQDGISLVQTAEGALTEVHSMLNRMVSLATKSANGTIQDTVDRDAIQTEVDSLNTEITRIAKSTNFNGINLLDGTMGSSGTAATIANTAGADPSGGAKYSIHFDVTPTTDVVGNLNVGSYFAFGFGDANGVLHNLFIMVDNDGTEIHANGTVTAAEMQSFESGGNGMKATIDMLAQDGYSAAMAFNSTFTVTADLTHFNLEAKAEDDDPAINSSDAFFPAYAKSSLNNAFMAMGANPTGTAAGAKTELDFGTKTGKDVIGSTMGIGGNTYEFVKTGGAVITAGNIAVNLAESDTSTAIASALATSVKTDTTFYDASAAGKYNVVASGSKLTITSNTTGAASVTATVTQSGSMSSGLTLQVGDTNDQYNKVTVSIGDLSAEGLGTDGLDVSSQTVAGNSIATIKSAINTVSTNRGKLGAIQNRLEYAINNLDTTAENMDAANSRIRDTDMAKEMMNYTKMNILSQAAQSMLAQANQNPQSILQLLQ